MTGVKNTIGEKKVAGIRAGKRREKELFGLKHLGELISSTAHKFTVLRAHSPGWELKARRPSACFACSASLLWDLLLTVLQVVQVKTGTENTGGQLTPLAAS